MHIESVESPRQRLEDFFMGIVENARAEQASTSGAAEAGPTAAFLREEGAAGEDLIDALSTETEEDPPLAVERGPGLPGETEAGNAKRQERTDAVLDELMESEASDAGEEPPATSTLPEVDESVDSGFIDDLLGDSDDGRKE